MSDKPFYTLRGEALALSVAVLVVGFGMFMARTGAVPFLSNQVTATASDFVSGFGATFGNIPSHVAAKIEKADRDVRANYTRVSENISHATAQLAVPALTDPDFSATQLANTGTWEITHAVRTSHPAIAPTALTMNDLLFFAHDSFVFLITPSRITGTLAGLHRSSGVRTYTAIRSLCDSYDAFIETAGVESLALAATLRDSLAHAPQLVSKVNLALGTAIIDATHIAIRADVALVYAVADAAPRSAHAVVALLGETGNVLAGATARVPALATALYLRTVEAPSLVAPALAQAIFDVEYAGATRLVALAHLVSDNSLVVLRITGRFAHDGVLALRSLGGVGPAALEDAALATLGTSALALDSLTRAPEVVSLSSTVRTAMVSLLAAVAPAPALTLGEQVALITYDTINELLNTTNRVLAFLLGPPSTIVLPSTPNWPIASMPKIQAAVSY